MVTDAERREVVRRLRELEIGVIGTVIPTGELSKNILKEIDYCHSDAMTPYGRLADLIEPGEPKVRCVAEVKVDGERLEELVHDAAVKLTGIDCEALLALAEDVRGYCIERQITPWVAGRIYDCIREALGVES